MCWRFGFFAFFFGLTSAPFKSEAIFKYFNMSDINNFFTVDEVLNSFKTIIEQQKSHPTKITEDVVANHLMVLSLALQIFHKHHFHIESKFYQDLNHLCQNQKTFPCKTEALQLIKELYNTSDGGVGGYGHIVFDDGNIENGHIEWCIKEAKENKYKKDLSEETRLASIKALECFLQLSENEREEVYDRFWIEND